MQAKSCSIANRLRISFVPRARSINAASLPRRYRSRSNGRTSDHASTNRLVARQLLLTLANRDFVQQFGRRLIGGDLVGLGQGRMLQFRRHPRFAAVPDATPGIGLVAGLARLAGRLFAVRRAHLGRERCRSDSGHSSPLSASLPTQSSPDGTHRSASDTGDGFVVEGLNDQFARRHRPCHVASCQKRFASATPSPWFGRS